MNLQIQWVIQKKESIAQGLANIITGLFGGMGGCAMIGQSMINYNNGARKYISTFFAALFLLFFISIGKDIISVIPLAALVGVMFIVVYKTFAWDSIFIHKRASYFDAFIVLLVSITTVISGNLALGVTLGIIASVLRFTWSKTTNLSFDQEYNEDNKELTVFIKGILFFGSEKMLKDELRKIQDDMQGIEVDQIVLDFKDAKVVDYSSANVIIEQVQRLEQEGHIVLLNNMNQDSSNKITRINKGIKA